MADESRSLDELMRGCFAPRRVTLFVNAHAVDRWQHAMEAVATNRFQDVALTNFLEGMHTLIVRRDEVDDLRDSIWEANSGSNTPTAYQQKQFQRVASSYYDEFYATLSKLSGVVARFADVFVKNFSDNAPFIAWLVARYRIPGTLNETLTLARQFRAILAHPQQFPAYDWGTTSDMTTGGLLRLMLWGPLGRGKNTMPPGALSNEGTADWMGPGWHFLAPAEVGVTNTFAFVSEIVLADIVSTYSSRSAFSRGLSLEEVRAKFHPADERTTEEYRRVPSGYDHADLSPAQDARPWTTEPTIRRNPMPENMPSVVS